VCIFGYNENAIDFMMRSQPQMLEQTESIEMLRPIEHGILPIMIPIHTLNHSVDVKSDIPIVEKILKDRGEV
jgi:CMP-2-keto-3-deoxyoctulosonic acid synthetase